VKCDRCSEPILYPKTAWHRVRGWDQDREQGGTNTIALRQRTGVVVCNGCMEELKLVERGAIPRKRKPIDLGDPETRAAIRAVTDGLYPTEGSPSNG
jgi:hypothetical protein